VREGRSKRGNWISLIEREHEEVGSFLDFSLRGEEGRHTEKERRTMSPHTWEETPKKKAM